MNSNSSSAERALVQFTKKIDLNKLVTNKAINEFMLRKGQYWTPLSYRGRFFIMTFEYNVYEAFGYGAEKDGSK